MVLAFVEHADGAPAELSLQALTLARGFAGGEPVQAVMAGPGALEAAQALGEYGVAMVHVPSSPAASRRRHGGARSQSWPDGSSRRLWLPPAATAATRSSRMPRS